ncbi:MAG: hypothetical protein GF418_09295 [Chitinivibrionales bacterium]|nr:hypothetical protein [Chitinivibrionales bacterium]MBD3395803.1 hypothetical protein [Chitinivibrionales bacterium]
MRSVLCLCATILGATAAAGRAEVSFKPHVEVYHSVLRIEESNEASQIEFMNRTGDVSYYSDNSGAVIQSLGGRLGLSARFGARLSATFTYDNHIWHVFQGRDMPVYDNTEKIAGGVHEGYLKVALGPMPAAPVVLRLGYFNMRYAPEVMNLGEYLFRTGVYPGYVLSGGEGIELLGAHVQTTIVPHLTQDLLFTSEINIFPAYDYSLSYLARVDILNIAEIGAGAMLYRVVSVREENTYNALSYVGDGADTTRIPLSGNKLMGRLVIDPKPLFNPGRMGPEDLKLYCEAALLGTKDYPEMYEDIRERVPVMAGVHVPMFNLLDVLAVEVEWYGTPHGCNPENSATAVPLVQEQFRYGDRDDWKWAVTATREIVDGFEVTARAARDHLRMEDGNGWYQPRELMKLPGDWYWSVRSSIRF